MIVIQANKKGWNNKTKFLLEDKLPEEYEEFIKAVKSNDPEEIAKEFIDFMYIAVQLLQNSDPKFLIDLDDVFNFIYKRNFEMKKKTKDENDNWVRK